MLSSAGKRSYHKGKATALLQDMKLPRVQKRIETGMKCTEILTVVSPQGIAIVVFLFPYCFLPFPYSSALHNIKE